MTQRAGSDFKWFGEGFEGFPRRLPEDCVEYSLYIVNARLRPLEVRQQLREVQHEARSLLKSICKDHIWQRENFNLELASAKSAANASIQSPPVFSCLYGKTCFGDSIDDEWLIVYILHQLSEKYQDLWIRIVDGDGQFFLVEAANELPKWLSPDNAEFRVWINQGKLLIIPRLDQTAGATPHGALSPVLTLEKALHFIEGSKFALLHLPELEKQAFYRIQKFPQKIQDNLHHAFITVPRKLAWLLHQESSYISPAIEAFYLRDSISLRSLQGAQVSAFVFPLNDFVTVSIKFTKVGYAQLVGQHSEGPETTSVGSAPEGNRQRLPIGMEVGRKVTAGFEMLLSDPQYKDLRVVREIRLLLDDIDNSEVSLPSEEEMKGWSQRADDEQWLDVDFAEFENGLSGTTVPGRRDMAGFGDKAMEEHLQKITARFKHLVQDGDVGSDAHDYSDSDDEVLSISDQASDEVSEHDEIILDKERFDALMREMTGTTSNRERSIPPDFSGRINAGKPSAALENGEDVLRHADEIEAELRDAGIF